MSIIPLMDTIAIHIPVRPGGPGRMDTIKGLSAFDYGALASWQEPTFPQRAQCPSGTGCSWTTRPVANKLYIAVPIELVPNFTIAKANNQVSVV
jgi:hypothetical protein